ncbi:cholesterol oxidase substrate-binding domain-containing protein [Acetobacter sicerae]|uniref:cholesterol oxidase substrate-binding domain-containing protein n=1 Tax=Acetobacter sicerae TaxID=85325 RepID=UPI00156B89A1|nr:cholesterol oxidase substrate-binding domain-containing protein [Acetobacter sicerae]NHN90760.1 FAD-binding protein [Acetobacter sicerae]
MKLSRRSVLKAGVSAGCVAGGTVGGFRTANAGMFLPFTFPRNVHVQFGSYVNWSQEINIPLIKEFKPTSVDQLVSVINWAAKNGYRVRPRGSRHNWSPINVNPNDSVTGNVLVADMTALTAFSVNTSGATASITAQPGIMMDDFLTKAEQYGLGLVHCPAPGDLSLGGALAINGHGTAIPAKGERLPAGGTYGSLSNLILALKAIVWDDSSQAYVVKTFTRDQPEIAPFLTHIGRAFIVEVTLQMTQNFRMRCQSLVNVSADELFAAPGSSGRTIAALLDQCGRVETIQFPFTSNPWLKIWTVAPTKPPTSRQVTGPFNYPFSDLLPLDLTNIIGAVDRGSYALTPLLGATAYGVVTAGLALTNSADIWGWAHDTQHYIRPTTLRVTANGYAVHMSRSNIQRAVHEFYVQYQALVKKYQNMGLFPMNSAVEIRITGLDHASDVSVANAVTPTFSALSPRVDHPEWDVAVWFDILTIPGTPAEARYYTELESWMFSNFQSYGCVRAEWSKGWAYTNKGAWTNQDVINTKIPESFNNTNGSWNDAVAILDKYDPKKVFTANLLNSLFS